jgi:hypothetical protein
MKRLLPLLILFSLLLTGCESHSEQERLDFIREKYKTNEIVVVGISGNSYGDFVFRCPDGSIWTMVRGDSMAPNEALATRQIFAPHK